MMPRVILLLVVFGASSCALSQDQSFVSSNPVFHVNVEVAVLDAQVLHKKTGLAVTGLTTADFALYENGMRQQIRSLSQDKLPLSVVFLFDLTDSVRPVLKPLAEGALQALGHLKPEDEAAVMVYAAATELVQGFTTDHEKIAAAIRKASDMQSSDAAFFNEAIYQAAMESRKATIPASRRVIIWLTDNIPNIPSEEIRLHHARSLPREAPLHSEREALDQVFKSGVVICTLLETSEMSESEFMHRFHDVDFLLQRGVYPPGDVHKYSGQTGGQVVESNSRKEVSKKMAELIDQIRTRYALSFHPEGGQARGKLHRVELRIAPEVERREGKVIVRTRQAYYR
jgi:VWFA-related protein